MIGSVSELAALGAGLGVDRCQFATGFGPVSELAALGAGLGVDRCQFAIGTIAGLAL